MLCLQSSLTMYTSLVTIRSIDGREKCLVYTIREIYKGSVLDSEDKSPRNLFRKQPLVRLYRNSFCFTLYKTNSTVLYDSNFLYYVFVINANYGLSLLLDRNFRIFYFQINLLNNLNVCLLN